MISKIKKPVSILLSLIMVFSVFTIVPLSASAAVGDALSEDDYLTFTAEEAGSTVTLKVASGSNLQYDLNGTGLTGYTAGTEIMLDAGDYVRFSGKDTTFNYSNHFSLTGKVAASGNVMSLRLDDDGKVQGLNSGCFQYMFYSCQGLTTAPELPETNLANSCYYYMFSGCTNLTTAPDLPATTLANSCYYYMFYRCTSLTQAPELPATELGDSCYYRMFYGCENLTKAPELPATELAGSCYCYMFSGCIKLTKAPELPATNLADSCYSNMFYGCTSLTELPALPATTLARTCYNYMFNGCSKICISDEAGTFDGITYSAEYRIPTTGEGTSAYNALSNMFRNTGGKFTGTPDINTTYYVPAPAATYTVTDASVNGTVTASVNGTNVTEAEENADVTLTVAPAEGYQFVSISAGDVSLTTVTEGSQYSFTMPKKPVTVTAVFEEAPAPELPDVIKDCTYYDSYWGVYANVPFAEMFIDIKDGAISFDNSYDTCIMDTKDYSYKFYDQTGTELEAVLTESYDDADGYGFRVIMNVFSFSNPVSGPLYIVATVPAFDDGVGERLAGYTLSLDGDIGVNFYMELAPEIAQSETAVMHFTIPNGNKTNEIDVPVSKATVSGKYHIFKCNVAAKEMTSVIKAQIIDGETTGTEYTYSVKEYADYLLTNANPKGTELEQAYAEASDLVVAMLNYGANAQLYFTPDTDPNDLANSGCETDLSGVTAQIINKSTYTNELNDVAEFSGATLSLKTQTTLSLYFTSDVDLTFNCAHEFEVEKKSGYQIIRIRNIHAKNLMDDFTVTVTAGENTGSVTYSPMNYCYNVLSDETQPEALQNACRALYLYAEAAGVYFD